MKIPKFVLMLCGIQPSEIDAMDWEDIVLFNVFYDEMKKAENGEIKHGGRNRSKS